MRQWKFFFVLTLIAAHGCKTSSYFKTPNDIVKKQAIVTMADGTQRKGLLSIKFGNNYERKEFVVLNTGGHDEKIIPEAIAWYRIEVDYYFPKAIDLYFESAKRILFVKRLTKESSRIQLYELYQEANETIDGLNDNYYYFISLPGHARLETWNTASKKLVPDFNLKMSSVVRDCPALADKIIAKQKGYFLPQLVFGYAAKIEVLKKIIEEYDNCR